MNQLLTVFSFHSRTLVELRNRKRIRFFVLLSRCTTVMCVGTASFASATIRVSSYKAGAISSTVRMRERSFGTLNSPATRARRIVMVPATRSTSSTPGCDGGVRETACTGGLVPGVVRADLTQRMFKELSPSQTTATGG